MKRLLLITAIALLLGVFAVAKFAASSRGQDAKPLTLETQKDSRGGVDVLVKPQILPAQKVVEFEITLDTHAGSLDQDLISAATLIDESGKSYKPASWNGDPLGGHHRSGTLRFEGLTVLKTMELKIGNIVGEEMIFKWEM